MPALPCGWFQIAAALAAGQFAEPLALPAAVHSCTLQQMGHCAALKRPGHRAAVAGGKTVLVGGLFQWWRLLLEMHIHCAAARLECYLRYGQRQFVDWNLWHRQAFARCCRGIAGNLHPECQEPWLLPALLTADMESVRKRECGSES